MSTTISKDSPTKLDGVTNVLSAVCPFCGEMYTGKKKRYTGYTGELVIAIEKCLHFRGLFGPDEVASFTMTGISTITA